MPKAIEQVLERLEGVTEKPQGWRALCPAHDDNDPSLSVSKGDDQPVVLHCWAGCRPEEVVAALGLEWADICEGESMRSSDSDTLSALQRERQALKRRKANTNARLERIERAKEKMTRHERMLFRLCCLTEHNGEAATEAKGAKRTELINRALDR